MTHIRGQNIVLEGPDGGGKSTLAAELSNYLRLPIQPGSGPPKSPGEIDERLRAYLQLENVIFDRHPAVSQPIYGQIRSDNSNSPDFALVQTFYDSKPLLIYCRTLDVSKHRVKEGEDPAHIAALTENYHRLVNLYDAWALRHARIVYRIGDDPDLIADMIQGVL